MKAQTDLKRIMEMAEKRGVQNAWFFKKTLEQYKQQQKMLRQLKKEINDSGMLTTKTYVKGRENVVAHPAVDMYNKTSTAANNTCKTLIDIIKNIPNDEEEKTLGDMISEMMADE